MEDQCRVLAAAVETLDDVFYVYDATAHLVLERAAHELTGLTDAELSGWTRPRSSLQTTVQPMKQPPEDVFET
ncbi:hypothetical protein C9J85_12565 [Haloferax sp. wsp5]|nr:hypothetical protein C9J85_12565 [Haloferax sp. wsp5]